MYSTVLLFFFFVGGNEGRKEGNEGRKEGKRRE